MKYLAGFGVVILNGSAVNPLDLLTVEVEDVEHHATFSRGLWIRLAHFASRQIG
jgi:hypothetical protein